MRKVKASESHIEDIFNCPVVYGTDGNIGSNGYTLAVALRECYRGATYQKFLFAFRIINTDRHTHI